MRFLLLIMLLGPLSSFGAESETTPRYSAAFRYTIDRFDKDLSDWHMHSLSLSRRFDFGSVIARANLAQRFEQQGSQFEMDSYPSLGEGRYAYLNFGYADASIFPRYRLGMELYQSVGYGIEVSGGFRKLWFSSSQVTVWTGSLAKYHGAYYIALRPVYTPKPIGDSLSGHLEIRRYLDDESYLVIKGGAGHYSDQRISNSEIFQADSEWISLGVNWHFSQGFAVNGSAGLERMEPRPDAERRQTTVSIGLEHDF